VNLKQYIWSLLLALSFVLNLLTSGDATPTENNGIRVLPAPGKVAVDGKANDWDLSGGIFVCDNVETQRDKYAVWLHAMYDRDNLYILARFIDATPLNNPGQTIADYGFAGDSLQLRIITAPGTPQERGNHLTAWHGADGRDVINLEGGTRFNEPNIKDAKTQGAQQAFSINADGKGYVQEIALPWKLLTRDGQPLSAGAQFTMTAEPNFTVGQKSRLSIKDIFKPGITPDRVFTFMAPQVWGPATLEATGHVNPQPVRLAGGRLFPVYLENGLPSVDWTGLIQVKQMPGFKPIAFTMPADGYISLNIKGADGRVVRHLLNGAFYTKGRHEVLWDGLTTPNWNMPGQPVAPGTYTWSALLNTGIGLKLRGWAANGGTTPWDNGANTNWGGDHGIPVAAATDKSQVYLGWSMAEAGKALIGCDLNGNVKWSNNRAGIAGVKALVVDNGVVYVLGGASGPAAEGAALYKLNAKDGTYLSWGDSTDADLMVKGLWPDATGKPEKADGIEAKDGTLFLNFTSANLIAIVDAKTGKLLQIVNVLAPSGMRATSVGFIAGRSPSHIYVLSGGTKVLRVNPWSGQTETIIDGLTNATCLTTDDSGKIYVGVGEPDNQVKVFNADGHVADTIGRAGGRALQGQWQPDGMRFIHSLAVSGDGKLWVAEADDAPKRVSAWDIRSGQLSQEFFGPTSYGATGGAIDPLDPNIMAGQGCEWRIDPTTGRATCRAVITRDGMGNVRFGVGSNGRLYLVVASAGQFEAGKISIFERISDANYKLRSQFTYDGKGNDARTTYWADANGDGQRQASEENTIPGTVRFSGWYMWVTPDLTLYAGAGNYSQFKVKGFTPAGAPLYDLQNPIHLPNAGEQGGMGAGNGLGSADGRLMLYNGAYGVDRAWFDAYDIATGKMIWSYPNNFVGVHGSHNATPAEPGLIRGAFDITGTAKLPAPIGNIWVIPTNVGEWHILTGDGFYLTRLFQPDPLQVQWSAQAVPGADVSNAPPGMGGEDFGGSIAYTPGDRNNPLGHLYLQAGKTAFWNVEVTGLESVRALPGGTIRITAQDELRAQAMHDAQLQAAVGTHQMTVKRMTPTFTGNLDNDFKGAELISYKKSDEAAVRSAAAWDEQNLYLTWDVKDNSPWLNSAADPTQLYLGGDTVDFQIGTNPTADKNRGEAALSDLRLSIGNFQGRNLAMLYRKVARDKKPKTFSSGVIKAYPMDFVDEVRDAKITVNKRADSYVVEAIIPLTALELKPVDGLTLHGDFGVTHGDPAGGRTRLRTYWNNQHTGIVDDAVFELQMEPKNWGELNFKR